MGELSGVLQLTDLNDFIGPGQECVKPIQLPKHSRTLAKSSVASGNNESSGTATLEGLVPQKAQITLNDCLACSGCVTSAETVLIAEQTHALLMQVLAENAGQPPESRKVVVVSVAPQVRASLAARFQLSLQEAGDRLCGMLKTLGVDYVFDVQLARNLSLYTSSDEFIRRFKLLQASDLTPNASYAVTADLPAKIDCKLLPMIASACPGWICYAEKTHGNFILPYVDKTKSPQQVMGSLVKYTYADDIVASCSPARNFTGNVSDSSAAIFHATLMPCYDKKLEASRADFYNDVLGVRDVDMVITAIEIEDLLINKLCKQLLSFPSCSYDKLLQFSPRLRDRSLEIDESASHFGGGAGGYCENIFVDAARRLFGQADVIPGKLQYKVHRNQDFQDLILTVDGQEKLRFAKCYGFRNIQNIVQQLKRNRCVYHYVEIMACPSACLNGGGQIRPFDFEKQVTVVNDDAARKRWLQNVEDLYEQAPKRMLLPEVDAGSQWIVEFYDEVVNSGKVASISADVLNASLLPNSAGDILLTQYQAIQRPANGMTIKW